MKENLSGFRNHSSKVLETRENRLEEALSKIDSDVRKFGLLNREDVDYVVKLKKKKTDGSPSLLLSEFVTM